MATEIRVPTLGESVTEATIGRWFKKPGEAVKADEPLVELETDKVTLEVNAPSSGVLSEIVAKDGDTVGVGALLGSIGEGAAGGKSDAKAESKPAAKAADKPQDTSIAQAGGESASSGKPAAAGDKPGAVQGGADEIKPRDDADHGPAVQRIAAESGVDPSTLAGSGKDGRVSKGDMLQAAAQPRGNGQQPGPQSRAVSFAPSEPATPVQVRAPAPPDDSAREERVRMTKLRQTIARRLKEAQSSAAMLTTFNDVDMTAVMEMRSLYKDPFEKKHGVKLGFMGFFVKACVQALKDVPAVNAEIDGTDIIYKNYYHIGVAVGTDKGLVVPVVRDADQMSIAEVEKSIAEYGKRARDGQLKIEDMQGGTFTISNGGIYGSLLSTPILNAPQSAILGMHRIEQRPVVHKGQIVARPMMYLAVSYDHRIVDGKEAVTFLVRIKENLEDPARLVLDL